MRSDVTTYKFGMPVSVLAGVTLQCCFTGCFVDVKELNLSGNHTLNKENKAFVNNYFSSALLIN